MTTYDEMEKLIPSQFHDQPNLNIFLRAFADQYDELTEAIEQMNFLSLLDIATGKALDGIGNILSCTREDACKIVGVTAINDDTYRKALKFMIITHNGRANYSDVREAIELLWGDIHKTYSEFPNNPATFFINLDDVHVDDDDPASIVPLIITPNGVQGVVYNTFYDSEDFTDREIFTRETIAYDAYTRYNGVYKYNGFRLYQPQLVEEDL